jgi:hypothetical protein
MLLYFTASPEGNDTDVLAISAQISSLDNTTLINFAGFLKRGSLGEFREAIDILLSTNNIKAEKKLVSCFREHVVTVELTQAEHKRIIERSAQTARPCGLFNNRCKVVRFARKDKLEEVIYVPCR